MKKHLLCLTAILSAIFSSQLFAENYKIIIDAGSTGSRLHLFQYETNANFPVIEDIFSESTSPGLSSFEKNPQAAGQSLQKLLDDAVQKLQAKQVNPNQVEINVLATAGMRLLPENTQHDIYASVLMFILAKNYGFKINHIETISGQMESVYGWLDINYLAENFQNHTPTVGSIDMGGASTQIAYATSDFSKPDDILTFKLGGQSYSVFAKSFLGLGQDQARDSINKEAQAKHCYPTGYQMNTTTLGNFDFSGCAPLYANVIEKNKVAQQLVSFDKQQFIAFSGAYYTFNFLAADQEPNQAAIEKRILAVCTKSWDQLKKDYPKVADKYLSVYCSNAVYMDDLFFGTYQLQNKQLSITTKINKKDIDWTLGAALFGFVN